MLADPFRFASNLLPELDWSRPDVGMAIHMIIGHVHAFDKKVMAGQAEEVTPASTR